MKHQLTIETESKMLALGKLIADEIEQVQGLVLYLSGQLGAGKTTFARGILQALGHKGHVKSPTYSLVEPYTLGNLQVFHIDLYRLNSSVEVEYLGLSDYLTANAICLIEWPEKALEYLPEASLYCTIELLSNGNRVCHFESKDVIGEALLTRLIAT